MTQSHTASREIPILQSERIFRYLVESIRDYAIFLLNPEGYIASWNPGAERLKGYKPHEIIGKHFSVFYSAEEVASGKPAHELKVAAQVGSVEDEGWRIRKDGSRFWADVVISRVLDETGELIGFGKITRDLTERREAEQQYRRLIEGVTDYAIYSLDAKGHITSWNAGAKRMKGYETAEILGQHFSNFYTVEDVERGQPARVLETAMREGHFEGEGWRIRKDGTRFWSNVVVTAIRDEEGTLLGFSKITRDVTDRKALLDTIQQHSQELEIRIKEREQTNAELEAFSYSVSHDLRAPIRAIEGFTDIILEDFGEALPAQAKEYLQQIVSSTARMNRLVQDLLNYGRLSRIELDIGPVNVESVINEACNQLDAEVRSRVSVSVDSKLMVKAHAAVFRQVISNLMNNAVKFTKPGMPPKVEVRAFRHDNFVHIEVRDEGIGIAAQHQGRIFQVFERLHNAEEYPGTGIGLAIVKRGVTRMGGTVSLQSEVGKGSTFKLEFPAA
jgi:PAS domain S-box-containing protein